MGIVRFAGGWRQAEGPGMVADRARGPAQWTDERTGRTGA